MITATMPRKRGPGRPRKHGGRREGSGRKPTEGVGLEVVGLLRLTPQQRAKAERWQEANGLDTFAEAVRQMIDAAPE
jgi:hypothetical protein